MALQGSLKRFVLIDHSICRCHYAQWKDVRVFELTLQNPFPCIYQLCSIHLSLGLLEVPMIYKSKKQNLYKIDETPYIYIYIVFHFTQIKLLPHPVYLLTSPRLSRY